MDIILFVMFAVFQFSISMIVLCICLEFSRASNVWSFDLEAISLTCSFRVFLFG
ncbi:hypothetical protein HanRHA438_Chr11g0486451 [Helianthus annuus]|nr:hypothetical protein HanRHA438_Chr11g0486451 [Helianthus annuus]